MSAGIDHVIFSLSLSSKWSSEDRWCEKKIQRIQKIWASHKKKNWFDYAQPNKNEENKEKEPKPDTKGHDKPFWKEIQKKKVKKQAQVILSLKIP